MKKIITTIIVMFSTLALFAEFDGAHSDNLFYNQHEYQADFDYLEEALSSSANDTEKAAILWRMSRTRLTLTDEIPASDKAARLAGYGEAQSFAEQSLAAGETPNGYHWLASSIGRIGQVNGPLNSLAKAKPMLGYIEKIQNDLNADMSDSWYVLGILYNQLPGKPLSFGDKDYAISYMRRCIDTQDNVNRTNLTNYIELSNQLYDRNWTAKRRGTEADKMKAKYDKETVPTEKMKYYEGKDGRATKAAYASAAFDGMSDREEAIEILEYALTVYDNYPTKLESDTTDAETIKERLNKIK